VVQGRHRYGADEFGFKAAENRVSIHDLHPDATSSVWIMRS
jgi:hypothetical protein